MGHYRSEMGARGDAFGEYQEVSRRAIQANNYSLNAQVGDDVELIEYSGISHMRATTLVQRIKIIDKTVMLSFFTEAEEEERRKHPMYELINTSSPEWIPAYHYQKKKKD